MSRESVDTVQLKRYAATKDNGHIEKDIFISGEQYVYDSDGYVLSRDDVDENGNKVDGELSALSLKRDGMRASKQFYATIGITSKDTVNVSISSTEYGSMKSANGKELHWTLKMKDGNSWTTIIDKNSYDDAKVFYNHIPSEHGISSSEDILFELETESILMLEEGIYSTAITIKTEGME